MPVELVQKSNNIRVTITADGSELLSSHDAAIESIESQRASGLSDSVSISNGVETRTPKTAEQILSINNTHDIMIAAEKRMFQVRLLDLCAKELESAKIGVAYSDADIVAEKTSRKAKVDAELDAVVASKPTVDADVIKG